MILDDGNHSKEKNIKPHQPKESSTSQSSNYYLIKQRNMKTWNYDIEAWRCDNVVPIGLPVLIACI